MKNTIVFSQCLPMACDLRKVLLGISALFVPISAIHIFGGSIFLPIDVKIQSIVWQVTVVSLLFWCFIFAMLYRINSTQTATKQEIPFVQAWRYAFSHFWQFFGTLLIVAVMIGLPLTINTILAQYHSSSQISCFFTSVIGWINSSLILVLALPLLCNPSVLFIAITMDDCDSYEAVSRGIRYFYYKFADFLYWQIFGSLIFLLTVGATLLLLWLINQVFLFFYQRTPNIYLCYIIGIVIGGWLISVYTCIQTLVYFKLSDQPVHKR